MGAAGRRHHLPAGQPGLAGLLLRDPDLARIVRRLGGTIAPDGGPLTAAGWRRIRRWRQEWLALPSQVVPAVIGPDQVVRPGIGGLRYLADLAVRAGVAPRLQADADPADRSLVAIRAAGALRA